MNGRLSEIAEAVGGVLHGVDDYYEGASIDTRTLAPNALFFALPGGNADGHEFVGRAGCLGAAAAVVSRPVDSGLPQIQVDDVETALQRAGAHARRCFKGTVVGVTGSNGKTTVKQMLAAICAEAGPSLATLGNLNNQLGVPLTLMRLDAHIDYAVIEMGASHAGDIAMLCELARPHIGLVNNAGAAHLEGFGSQEGVARAKGELFTLLDNNAVAVINADDYYAPLWREMAGRRSCLQFALDASAGADIYASDIEDLDDGARFMLHTPAGRAAISLPLAGRHNIANALAAAAVAHALDIGPAPVARAILGTESPAGRLKMIPARHGARLIDDSYNANPDSMAAAIEYLARQPGQRWAVLGDMSELGVKTQAAHADTGAAARRAGIERLWATGVNCRQTVEAFGQGGRWFADREALIAELESALQGSSGPVTLLVKGSRSAGMDRVVDALKATEDRKAGASC